MATQGLVTIVKGGVVVLKFITGSDGQNEVALAAELRKFGKRTRKVLPTRAEAYELARRVGFGSSATLVVMDGEGVEFRGEGDLHERYRRTFLKPRFNPRWEHGTAPHVRVINWERFA